MGDIGLLLKIETSCNQIDVVKEPPIRNGVYNKEE